MPFQSRALQGLWRAHIFEQARRMAAAGIVQPDNVLRNNADQAINAAINDGDVATDLHYLALEAAGGMPELRLAILGRRAPGGRQWPNAGDVPQPAAPPQLEPKKAEEPIILNTPDGGRKPLTKEPFAGSYRPGQHWANHNNFAAWAKCGGNHCEVPPRRVVYWDRNGLASWGYLEDDIMEADALGIEVEEYVQSILRDPVDLNLLDLGEEMSDRRVHLPPFKLNYETNEEARLRLKNTVIAIKSVPFLVAEVVGEGAHLVLTVQDEHGDRKRILYKDTTDLRNYAPGYVTAANNAVYYLYRKPERLFQQGLNSENTRLRLVGVDNHHPFRTRDLLPMLKHRKTHRWNEKTIALFDDKMVNQLRLSNNVAVYRKAKNLHVEYKSRLLGRLDGRRVILADEDDVMQSWITFDLNAVGLNMAVGG